ncbi:HWE histidine kinase domain-containing protein [Aurantimonas sp. Leaf443]|uniref:HWE histidine kinase domain-containing protein n=1 Tax=Aurantimonas sp. Leaf443 TaxID=1736378 RepID=UPI000B01A90C|nr:HWE histidine kinase domain-containing protein [Aurantimonas sp. Leaf443]
MTDRPADPTDAARFAALAEYHILDTSPEPGFEEIVELACVICETPVALVSLVAEGRQWFKARRGFEPAETPLSQSVCAHALREDRILVIEDLTADPRTACNTLVTEDPHIRFYAGAVIRNDEGVALGTVCAIDKTPRAGGLTHDQRRALDALARQAMTLIRLRRDVLLRDLAIEAQRRAEAKLRASEERRQTLTRELAHRMKNMLTLVQAVASQTFRTARSLPEVRDALAGRFSAMASAQDLLTAFGEAGLDFGDVVEAALAHHRDGTDRFEISGPALALSRQQGLGLSLAVNELATNAVKHGALATEAGRVSIVWREAEEGVLEFEWRERGGPPVVAPQGKGFGSRLLGRMGVAYFDGESELLYEPDGLVYRLRGRCIPADEL